jgi:D-alanyl-lipoteichoic acid acyltransferase DltB (MBOAT superfamily)
MLNNQLFYIISYAVKKYDGKYWHLYEYYYITGGMFIGMMISAEIWSIINIICMAVNPSALRAIYSNDLIAFFPLAVALLTTYYFKRNRHCDLIYKKISGYDKKKKKRILVVQILRVIVLFSIFYLTCDMVRETLHSSGTELSKKLLEEFRNCFDLFANRNLSRN